MNILLQTHKIEAADSNNIDSFTSTSGDSESFYVDSEPIKSSTHDSDACEYFEVFTLNLGDNFLSLECCGIGFESFNGAHLGARQYFTTNMKTG